MTKKTMAYKNINIPERGEKIVTYDFARLMEGANEVTSSVFADLLIERR